MSLSHNNLLPFDGSAFYHPEFFEKHIADAYFTQLLHQIPWQHDEVIMFGKKITTKRKVAWFGDAGTHYTYANVPKIPLPWNEVLMQIKKPIESKCNKQFNAVLLNLYANGHEGMGWHSDNEKEMHPNGLIASISLGAERTFRFRHKTSGQQMSIVLGHGSLLTMDQVSQDFWRHQLPVSKPVMAPRINLTFRQIITETE